LELNCIWFCYTNSYFNVFGAITRTSFYDPKKAEGIKDAKYDKVAISYFQVAVFELCLYSTKIDASAKRCAVISDKGRIVGWITAMLYQQELLTF